MSARNKELQEDLTDLGFDPGPIDGILGPKTSAALEARLASLGYHFRATVENAQIVLRGPVPAPVKSDHEVPWMALAYGQMGLHETRDNKDLRAFLKSDGGTVGDPARIAWCADFVHTCLRLSLPGEKFTGRVRENPYLAFNWTEFGVECEPCVGAILSFHERGKPNSIYGHLALYVGEDDRYYYVLGGNQSNAVTVTKIEKGRLRPNGSRWPITSPLRPTGPRYITQDVALSVNET